MRPTLTVLFLAGVSTAHAQPKDSSKRSTSTPFSDSLIALEKRSWVAWRARDSAFFRDFLTSDHVEVGFSGPSTADAVVKTVGSPACKVSSYEVGQFKVTRFSTTTALVVYHAAQETTCAGKRVPSPVWVSSLYVLRDGRWRNAAYQQTAIPR